MKYRLWLAGILIFTLAMRNAIDPLQPWFSHIATSIAMTALWAASFWVFKVYGLALEGTQSDSILRPVLEYGLPALVLFAIVQHGRGGPFDMFLAMATWWSVGAPWRPYRQQWHPFAIRHVERFLSECGVRYDLRKADVQIWPLHVAVIAFAVVVASVPGL